MSYLVTNSGLALMPAGLHRQTERYPIARRPSLNTSVAPIARRRFASGGMGTTTAQWVGTGGSLAAPVVTAVAAPAVAAALGITVGLAVPIVGAAFAGILFGVEALLNSGCGQTCVVTSQWANQAEPLLRENCDKFFSLPSPTAFDQQSALNVFDAVWAGLVQRCSQPGLSTAGQNCIADRQRGACKWHATANSPWPNGPKQGECWNWFNAYRTPIELAAVSSVGASLLPSFDGVGSSNLLPLALVAALLVAAVAI